jgi:hypothetical protein
LERPQRNASFARKEIYESKAFLPRVGFDAVDFAGTVLWQERGDRLCERVGGSRERLRRVAEEAEQVREPEPADDGARWTGDDRDAGCGARAVHPPERGGEVAGGGRERERPHGRLADAQIRHLICQEAHCHALAGGPWSVSRSKPQEKIRGEGGRRGTGRRFLGVCERAVFGEEDREGDYPRIREARASYIGSRVADEFATRSHSTYNDDMWGHYLVDPREAGQSLRLGELLR